MPQNEKKDYQHGLLVVFFLRRLKSAKFCEIKLYRHIDNTRTLKRMVHATMYKRGKRKGANMSETVWHDGWPKKEGWYRCLLDGEAEMNLKYYTCTVSMKKHWVDNHGDYIETMAHVQWCDEKPQGCTR